MNKSTKKLVLSSLFLALAIVFQFMGKSLPTVSQLFVGPIVNALLLMTLVVCDIGWGIGVGCLTPILAWSLGQLPAPFGPFIPFIAIGNAIYIVVFYLIARDKKKGTYFLSGKESYKGILAVLISAICKFLFLYISASKLIKLLSLPIKPQIANKLITAMGLFQLITAILGGILAILVLKLLKKRRQL